MTSKCPTRVAVAQEEVAQVSVGRAWRRLHQLNVPRSRYRLTDPFLADPMAPSRPCELQLHYCPTKMLVGRASMRDGATNPRQPSDECRARPSETLTAQPRLPRRSARIRANAAR